MLRYEYNKIIINGSQFVIWKLLNRMSQKIPLPAGKLGLKVRADESTNSAPIAAF
jgi:hypothetical protein